MSGASKLMSKLTPRLIPEWLAHYPRENLGADIAAGLIVTILVIPQSLA